MLTRHDVIRVSTLEGIESATGVGEVVGGDATFRYCVVGTMP